MEGSQLHGGTPGENIGEYSALSALYSNLDSCNIPLIRIYPCGKVVGMNSTEIAVADVEVDHPYAQIDKKKYKKKPCTPEADTAVDCPPTHVDKKSR